MVHMRKYRMVYPNRSRNFFRILQYPIYGSKRESKPDITYPDVNYNSNATTPKIQRDLHSGIASSVTTRYQPLPMTTLLPTWMRSPQTSNSRKAARSRVEVIRPVTPR